jgi:outer membrane autotransporter protein
MNLTNNLETLNVAGTTTLADSTVYFYDANDLADKYNAISYRTLTTDNLTASGTDTLFMRTNANGLYGGTLASGDEIISNNAVTGNGTYNISIFDQGMRNGYMGVESNSLEKEVILLTNAQANTAATYNTTETAYDNGVWSYVYQSTVDVNGDGNLVLTDVTTESAVASTAQKTAQDANKIAAGAAISAFGTDETLIERLGDLRNNTTDKSNGVWAKYVGSKIKVNGLSADSTYKSNGLEAGYDHKVGKNWIVGIAGTSSKGDTTLYGGDGEIKTYSGALYGTWLGEKGHHLDIIAKVGKVDSKTHSYGGTIAQQMDGDFSSSAIGLAVQYGYRKSLKNNWYVEPLVRASYVKLGSSDYTVTTNDGSMSVNNDSVTSMTLRGGFVVGKKINAASNFYLKAAVLHDFNGDIVTNINADGRTAQYKDSIGGTGFEYGFGINHAFNKNSNLYFDVERISGGELTKDWGINLGFRYNF